MVKNRGKKSRSFEAMKEDAVLAVRLSAIGDVAMSLPALYDACTASRQRHFILLTKPRMASIFTSHPQNLTIVTPDLDCYRGLYGLWRLFRELKRKYGFSTMVDLHDVLRTKVWRLLARLSGMRVAKIHKGRRRKKALTRARHKQLTPLQPTIERYRDTFRRAGIELPGLFRGLYPPEGAPVETFAEVHPPKKEGEAWIAIAPFAAHAGKIYPLELMEEVVAHFAAKPQTTVFVFGFGKKENETISRWADKYGVVNMAAKGAGMAREIALLSHCDVMISMDSANMHLASLAGCRVVSIWGATHHYCGFMGWQQSPEDAVQLDMPCRPCSVFGNKPCLRHDYQCLRGITPKMIINRVEKSL
ncbi:MAG: glycosyltransferase family 9 protein [Clostridium sp.]|nr:glycosyltransferase family 9 protein [Prevotella sp.]MCM1429613.1 glycosyltransferase family 9 protein [Clostridium sp.]MCM1476092.1 glycosyltransferase family 9 protein [Muribaculaceae bacterium]